MSMDNREEQEKLEGVLGHPDWSLYLKELRLAGFCVETSLPPFISRVLFISTGSNCEERLPFFSLGVGPPAGYRVWGFTTYNWPQESRFDANFSTLEEVFEYAQEKVSEM